MTPAQRNQRRCASGSYEPAPLRDYGVLTSSTTQASTEQHSVGRPRGVHLGRRAGVRSSRGLEAGVGAPEASRRPEFRGSRSINVQNSGPRGKSPIRASGFCARPLGRTFGFGAKFLRVSPAVVSARI
eukprot:2903863-Alexandrium_andersonii.AAC.1